MNPSEAKFIIDRRLVPGEDRVQALKEITDVLDNLKKQNPDYEYKLEVTSNRPFLDIDENDPFIQTLVQSQKEVLGTPGIIHRRAGGSDAANIQEATGMPIPNYAIAEDIGPGGSGQPDERISMPVSCQKMSFTTSTQARRPIHCISKGYAGISKPSTLVMSSTSRAIHTRCSISCFAFFHSLFHLVFLTSNPQLSTLRTLIIYLLSFHTITQLSHDYPSFTRLLLPS